MGDCDVLVTKSLSDRECKAAILDIPFRDAAGRPPFAAMAIPSGTSGHAVRIALRRGLGACSLTVFPPKVAALPGGRENLGDGGLYAFMIVGDDELDAAQASPGQLSKKLSPDRLGLGCADLQAEHLASTVCVHGHRDDDCDRDDAPAASDFQVSGVDPEVGPFTFDGRPRRWDRD